MLVKSNCGSITRDREGVRKWDYFEYTGSKSKWKFLGDLERRAAVVRFVKSKSFLTRSSVMENVSRCWGPVG